MVIMTYIIELIYIIISIFAWRILKSPDPNNDCLDNAKSLGDLLVDVIILIYMRTLRLISISIAAILVGPFLLVCYCRNRPKPTEDPKALRENFNKVTISQL